MKKIKDAQTNLIKVKNADGDADTTAEIIVQNQIDYTPKVSVIIPVYNVEQYLRQCLDSVVNQTLKEIEIICVDDGSTDSSFEILKEYAAKDKRITVLKQQNLYAGVARNAGLAAAKGEYLCFLDSDDFFEPEMLEEMYTKAATDDSDVVVCGYYIYNQMKECDTSRQMVDKRLIAVSPFSPLINDSFVFSACRPTPWNKLIRHSLFTQYHLAFESLRSCNDFTCILTAVSVASKISFLDRMFVHYRWNTGSQLSTTRFGKNEMWILAAAALERNLKRLGNYDTFYAKIRFALNSSLYWETNNNIELLQETAQKYLSERLYRDLFASVTGPKVSVIVPVYNVEPYLKECLDSLVNQTLKEIEIICVDDGSTDNSLDILRNYADCDARIKILTQEHKKQGAARNLGLKIAQGKYIFFCDSDDFVKPETLENLYNKIESSCADLCQYRFFNYNQLNKKVTCQTSSYFDKIRKRRSLYYRYDTCYPLLFLDVEAAHKLYNRYFLLDNNIKFSEGCYFEDTIVHIKCMTLARRICFQDEPYYFYRCNREGQTTQKSSNTEKYLDSFNYIYGAEQFFKENRLWDEVKMYYYQFAVQRMCWYYNRCDDSVKLKYARLAKLWSENKKPEELEAAVPQLFKGFKTIINATQPVTLPQSMTPSYAQLIRNLSAETARKPRGIAYKKTSVKPVKSLHIYKLFNFIPLFTYKKRGGNHVWKILGLPIWRVRKFENNITVKYYLFGIPFIKSSCK